MAGRRSFIGLLAAAALGPGVARAFGPAGESVARQENAMFGLIGKFIAAAGRRDDLAAILLEGLREMPGNLSYIVANDPADADALWITEVWTDEAAHAASLSLPSVQDAIARGRLLVAGMEQIARTQPLGGNGLP
ncbi:putative quinol monooxygenase [Croceicoccus mobilis]|uniref:ABM domain-containing protein n=1 Tax=Croceicoccus mobilis TaxID=1703339 RepID=A0A916YUK3_9SPHN|nr:putative quinol monooxygenase [Croceicoccus mobilis]GGD62626.1 hypothetical protein GCM10010990_10040 [Croceicoccus mobilis]